MSGRGRGGERDPPLAVPMRPRPPASSTARSRQGILEPGERTGANGSAANLRAYKQGQDDRDGAGQLTAARVRPTAG